MTKFVYVSDEYRQAWQTVLNVRNSDNDLYDGIGWPKFTDSFVEEFNFKAQEEEHYILKYTRPRDWFLNDMWGEHEYLFNMSQHGYTPVPYEYTDNLPSFSDLMMKRAEELRDTGKEIDLFYSGGIDSVSMLLALIEVCPKDQIRLIMGGYPDPVHEYPDMYKNIIINLPHVEMDVGDLFGQARMDKNVFTTGCEADQLFGAVGYTLMTIYAHIDPSQPNGYRVDRSAPGNLSDPKNRAWNNNRRENKVRNLLLTCSWRFLRNLHVSKVDMANYQPFFLHNDFERYGINLHLDDKMYYYTPSHLEAHKEEYKKCKMMIRDFIYEKTKDADYAYGAPKTITKTTVQNQLQVPLSPNWTVLAVTEDGTVVNRENILDFITKECLTID
tara:strand:+ start:2349 stop:3503 length:1155 start_codon:yes stop_codon:yes gene_type:complete